MDPPTKKFHLNSQKLLADLRVSLWVLFANFCILLTLIIFTLAFFGQEKLISLLADYQKINHDYFTPLKNIEIIKIFIKFDALNVAIYEEIIYRGPIWFLAYYEFKLISNRLTWTILLAVSIYLNYLWALPHVFILPIFLVGIPIYVSVIKTKNIFVPIFCHFLSNLSLFFLVHALMYFKII